MDDLLDNYLALRFDKNKEAELLNMFDEKFTGKVSKLLHDYGDNRELETFYDRESFLAEFRNTICRSLGTTTVILGRGDQEYGYKTVMDIQDEIINTVFYGDTTIDFYSPNDGIESKFIDQFQVIFREDKIYFASHSLVVFPIIRSKVKSAKSS